MAEPAEPSDEGKSLWRVLSQPIISVLEMVGSVISLTT